MLLRPLILLLLGCTGAFAATTRPAAPDEVADRAAGQFSVELFVPPDALVADMADTYAVLKVINRTSETIVVPVVAHPEIPGIPPLQSRLNPKGWWLWIVIQPPAGAGGIGVSGPGARPTALAPHGTTLIRARFCVYGSPAGVHQIRGVLGHDKTIVAQSEIAAMARSPGP